jgi:hypothetical protein
LAAQQHGGRFGSLLWASPQTQALRFAALVRLTDFRHKSILDVGCGRADLLDYLLDRGIEPGPYLGLEAVDVLADAAEAKHHPQCTIHRCDFVREPSRLAVGADIVVFSGSLNTLSKSVFWTVLRTAFLSAGQQLVFNFLNSPNLANAVYLTWHPARDVLRWARTLSDDVRCVEDYLRGDATMAMGKTTKTDKMT